LIVTKTELFQFFKLLESKETKENELKMFVDSHEKIFRSTFQLLSMKDESFSKTEIFKLICKFLSQNCHKIDLSDDILFNFSTMIDTLNYITDKSEYENFVCEFIKQNR
jgi:hypothetical protein